MIQRFLSALFALCPALGVMLVLASDAEAGRGRRGGCSGGSCSGSQCVSQAAPQACAACPGGVCPTSMTEQVADVPARAGATPLEQVNDHRRNEGLAPYIEDPQLTAGAKACAEYRAARGIHGHCNDARFLAPGVMKYGPPDRNGVCQGLIHAGAELPETATPGFKSCCMTDRQYTHAGAYTAVDARGQCYHSLFVR